MKFETTAIKSKLGPFDISIDENSWSVYCREVPKYVSGQIAHDSSYGSGLTKNRDACMAWLHSFISEVKKIQVDVRV